MQALSARGPRKNRTWYTAYCIVHSSAFVFYHPPGWERGIVANRLSYFLGWHGPSMTVDTACSSSLVSLDLAVAVAAGTNLILRPVMYISESNLGMLSPNGFCAMWDASADGYARGEGVAAVLVKTLSHALADNDPIQCVIRETAVNQDGRTLGLTMPSNVAQAALIREYYARAGLDPIQNMADRPQFFHAHGTGTQAGNPQEAEAISSALFSNDARGINTPGKLLVGSIKTVIGHTEGTAGLASLIGTALASQNQTIPPNLHFQNLNPKIAPYFGNLEIPTVERPWTEVAEGQVRRASVNSFGFGGTNAHCILEEHIAPEKTNPTYTEQLYTSLVFSAASEKSLRTMLAQHAEYFRANRTVSLADVAYTLQGRRSTLAYRKTIPSSTVDQAIAALEELNSAPAVSSIPRFNTPASPKVLGIFTGQGAQWPRVGAQLLETSHFAAWRLAELDSVLEALPDKTDRPTWTLVDQLMAGGESSRIAEAALSQPLCTAVQVLLVDILRAAGVTLTAVVGHSSGEIAAAYAAGFLSDVDAICISYYRGVYASRAASPSSHAPPGARTLLAAVNSGSSVTLSGDMDAVGTFARKLKVDTDYHSAHMLPYGFQTARPPTKPPVAWYSSVFEGQPLHPETLASQYWADNMCKPVFFSDALSRAQNDIGGFDLAIEVGPHPALRGPALSVIGATPYTGLLARGESDIEQVILATGRLWTHLGGDGIQLAAVDALLSHQDRTRVVVDDLPPRLANHFKHRHPAHKPNPLLGAPCIEALTIGEMQWRNFLQPHDLPWLNGHQLQGQTVFAGMGYVSMAIEGLQQLAKERMGDDHTMATITVRDVLIPRAITMDDDDYSVEIIFSMSAIEKSPGELTANWACYSVADANNLALNAQGRVMAQFGPQTADTVLTVKKKDAYQLVSIGENSFYANLSRVGYGYSGHFRGLDQIRRRPGHSTGMLTDRSGTGWEDDLVVHPGALDSALQSILAAWSSPSDTQLWSLHVPVSVQLVNPYFAPLGPGGRQQELGFEAAITKKRPREIMGELLLRDSEGQTVVQIDGITLVSLSPSTARDDLAMFSEFRYEVATVDGVLAACGKTLSERGGLLRAFYAEDSICSEPTGRWLSRVVAQISHRFPDIHIFEVGAGTGATTSAMLEALQGSYGSYTFTDTFTKFFPAVEGRFGSAARMNFQIFDMEQAPSGQGFAEETYDVIIAVNVLHVSPDVRASLSNVRRLLKPGGFLVAAELTSTGLIFNGMTAGTPPGWWIGAESGRPWGVGFAGIDTVIPDISTSLPMAVFVSRAVDERVSLLRNPLAVTVHPRGVRTDALAVVGGTTWPVYKLARDVADTLGPRFGRIELFPTLPDLAASDLSREISVSGAVSILVLTDLDRLSALQACATEGTLIYMMLGILRALQNEHPDLNSQLFDLEAGQALYSWMLTGEGQDLLWTREPEVYVSCNGKHHITRLLPDQPRNDRYNALRRGIQATVTTSAKAVALVSVDHALALQEPVRSIEITHSFLQSVASCGAVFLRPCIGKDLYAGETVLALVTSSELVVMIPKAQSLLIKGEAESSMASLLVSVVTHLIAQRIMSMAPVGSTGVVHSAEPVVQTALKRQAKENNINLVFTTSMVTDTPCAATAAIYLHPRLSESALQRLLPKAPAFAVMFSQVDKPTIMQKLPASCLILHKQVLLDLGVGGEDAPTSFDIGTQLQVAFHATSLAVPISRPPVIALHKAPGHHATDEALTVVDWTASAKVTATVQPIASGTLFGPDRTYLFIGMAGELGQSLAGRSPRVEPGFIQDKATRDNPVVRALSLDITSQHSLLSVHATLKVTLPPIAGVVNGAMVLDDELFARMSHDQFAQVSAPKVRGTQLLDKLFRSPDAAATLHFFVVASGITAVIGWSGQSNYAAANEYMISLVHQRRKHGFPGSAMSIPAVLGIGYAAHLASFDFDYIASLGYTNIGEEDLHVLFAEAILASRPGTTSATAQVVMGVNRLATSAESLMPQGRRRDVKFNHLVRRDEDAADPAQSGTRANLVEPVSVKLARATSPVEAVACGLDESVPLVDRGVDSLVAVDIRTWFTKELRVDMPTLKILNGRSVDDLVLDAVEQGEKNSIGSGNPAFPGTKSPLASVNGEFFGLHPHAALPSIGAGGTEEIMTAISVEVQEKSH
ncbi:hypothetical protein BDW62DRAFT_208207 [Aspergillus aurantiobrunneus]